MWTTDGDADWKTAMVDFSSAPRSPAGMVIGRGS
jgi:hypothetical protein